LFKAVKAERRKNSMKSKPRLGGLFAIVTMVLSVTLVTVILVPATSATPYNDNMAGTSHTFPGVKVPDSYGTANGITWDANSTLMVDGNLTQVSYVYLILHNFLLPTASNASLMGNVSALVLGCEELVLATTKQVTVSTIRYASALNLVELAPTSFPTMGAAWDALAGMEAAVHWPWPLTEPVISVVPSVEKVHCGPTGLSGTTFTINVTISGLGDTNQGVGAGQAMMGYELRLGFNTSLINVTGADSHGRDLTHQVSSGDAVFPGAYMSPLIKWGTGYAWVPLDNVTLGIVDVGEILTMGYTGSGPLMGVIFHIIHDIPLENVTTPTNKTVGCPLTLFTTPLPAGYLYDTEANIIPCLVVNGFYNYTRAMTVPVIPEFPTTAVFPTTVIVPLFLIATIAATVLGKVVWSRKRRRPAVA
jgi:hypothetical protein